MNDDHIFWSRRLDEYVDGELNDTGAVEIEEHLAGCAACREELGLLTELRDAVRGLPAEIQPSRALWQGIEARIAPGAHALGTRGGVAADSRPERGRMGRWRWPAAAAAILVLVSSGTTALLLRQAAVDARLAQASPPVGLAAFASSEAEYESTVEALRRDLEVVRPRLQPETVAAVEQNLAIIDQAIAEAREALAADPLNADLPLLLAGVYRQKVELLRTAVTLPART